MSCTMLRRRGSCVGVRVLVVRLIRFMAGIWMRMWITVVEVVPILLQIATTAPPPPATTTATTPPPKTTETPNNAVKSSSNKKDDVSPPNATDGTNKSTAGSGVARGRLRSGRGGRLWFYPRRVVASRGIWVGR